MEQERGGRRNAARAPDVLAGVLRGVDAAQDELAARVYIQEKDLQTWIKRGEAGGTLRAHQTCSPV